MVETSASGVLGERNGDEEFPVEWQDGEKGLFWILDDLHCPNPVSPMFFDIGGWWLTCDHMFRRFGTPFASDWIAKRVNGYSEQLSNPSVPLEDLEHHPFFNEFFVSEDRIGYWVSLGDPPGEDARSVARRQLTYAGSLADALGDSRYILSTHSPVLRAILLECFGEDPGEPKYLEPIDLTVEADGSIEVSFRDEARSV